MRRGNIIVSAIVAIIFALSLLIVLPIDSGILGKRGVQLGLDLVGGSHLVYQVQVPEGADKTRAMARTLEVIRTRIDKYGVAEPVIQSQEGDRILVELPGFADIDEAKNLVEQMGFLQFREVELKEDGTVATLSDYLAMESLEFFDRFEIESRIFLGPGTEDKYPPLAFLVSDGEGNLSFIDETGNPLDMETLKQTVEEITTEPLAGSPTLISWIAARGDNGTQLTGAFLEMASPAIKNEPTGAKPLVQIEWDDQGATIFDQIAGRLYTPTEDYSWSHRLGIFLDNVLISSPRIAAQVYGGKGVIEGNFTIAETESLANLLESGALPMPLEKPPLFEEVVSATLGANFIDMSVTAGIIGIILVMLFMALYYRLPGVIACLALLFYGALVLAIFKLIPVTLTLAGIGGFVLSIGMAVDANVLIFERMKEELRIKRTLGAAIETGFNRAWPAIRDSNFTTFIVCGILYWLGSSIVASAPVMGFALTLFIGVAVSMFTAIVVTRTLLRLFVGSRLAKNTRLFTVYSGRKHV